MFEVVPGDVVDCRDFIVWTSWDRKDFDGATDWKNVECERTKNRQWS